MLRRARRSGSRSGCACPAASSAWFRARTDGSAIVIAGKPRARVVDLSSGADHRTGQAASESHRLRLRAVGPHRREQRGRPLRASLGYEDMAGDSSTPWARRPGPRRRLRCLRCACGDREHGSDGSDLEDGHRTADRDALRSHGPRRRRLLRTGRPGRHGERRRNGPHVGGERAVARGAPGTSRRRHGSGVRRAGHRRDGRDGRDGASLGSRNDRRARALGRRAVLPPPRKRAETAGGDVVAEAVGSVIRLRRPGGVQSLRGHRDLVNAVQFSPDGRLLVSAGRDHDVFVWNVADGKIVHRFDEAHSASVADARFSPDGRWIVTAGPISARVWNVEDGRSLMYLYGPKPSVTAAAFEPDSRTIVTRETDGTVRRYACELCGGLEELSALARKRLQGTGRAITRRRAGAVPRLTDFLDTGDVGSPSVASFRMSPSAPSPRSTRTRARVKRPAVGDASPNARRRRSLVSGRLDGRDRLGVVAARRVAEEARRDAEEAADRLPRTGNLVAQRSASGDAPDPRASSSGRRSPSRPRSAAGRPPAGSPTTARGSRGRG